MTYCDECGKKIVGTIYFCNSCKGYFCSSCVPSDSKCPNCKNVMK